MPAEPPGPASYEVRQATAALEEKRRGSADEVFLVFLRLGCTSFGGPIAHLGYFENEFVERRRWLAGARFAELVALAQSLPGPASSQVGYAIGLHRAGLVGGLAAWLGFTLPSAALMLLFSAGYALFSGRAGNGLLHGLQLVAVAVVAQAAVTMQRRLAPDRRRMFMALLAAAIVLIIPFTNAAIGAIGVGALYGSLLLRESPAPAASAPAAAGISTRTGLVAAAVLASLFAVALLAAKPTLTTGSLLAGLFRSGSLVFGGGHVVLPLLANVVVSHGWMAQSTFLSGYGAAQALPGPLFSFAAFVGAAVRPSPHPLLFGLSSLLALFLPGLLLMTAILPFAAPLTQRPLISAALRGINCSVVGILIAAVYQPLWTSTVHTPLDFVLALFSFALLAVWQLPSLLVVAAMGTLGLLKGSFF